MKNDGSGAAVGIGRARGENNDENANQMCIHVYV